MSNHTDINLLIFPSYCYLDMAKSLLTHGDIGAQNISEFAEGAYTGDVSAKMVKSCGATYALLGHSECRHVFFETEDMIQKKIVLCNEHGLTPMLCVGETLEQRNEGHVQAVIEHQLKQIQYIEGRYMVAYEPVWAIGTGETATPEVAETVHSFIREIVGNDIPILYGGSVNLTNIESLLGMPTIDGTLIGGASLKPEVFCGILERSSMIERAV